MNLGMERRCVFGGGFPPHRYETKDMLATTQSRPPGFDPSLSPFMVVCVHNISSSCLVAVIRQFPIGSNSTPYTANFGRESNNFFLHLLQRGNAAQSHDCLIHFHITFFLTRRLLSMHRVCVCVHNVLLVGGGRSKLFSDFDDLVLDGTRESVMGWAKLNIIVTYICPHNYPLHTQLTYETWFLSKKKRAYNCDYLHLRRINFCASFVLVLVVSPHPPFSTSPVEGRLLK